MHTVVLISLLFRKMGKSYNASRCSLPPSGFCMSACWQSKAHTSNAFNELNIDAGVAGMPSGYIEIDDSSNEKSVEMLQK